MTRRLRFAALAAVAALAFSACANNDAKESDVVDAMEDAGLDSGQAECIGAGIDDEFGDDQDLYNDVAAAVDTDDFPKGDQDQYPDGTKPVIDDILAECLGEDGPTADDDADDATTETTAGTDTTAAGGSGGGTTTETTAAPAG